MLKGVDPILGPELLASLRAMGHGDELAIVDANFPAATLARRLYRIDAADTPRALAAIADLMPLDDFDKCAAWSMADAEGEASEVARQSQTLLRERGYAGEIEALSRQSFYERAQTAFAIVATGEQRLYGNLLLRKGVIRAGPLG